jgi:hypothetical protein
VSAAADALRLANGLQMADLEKSGKRYQPQLEEARFARAQQRFAAAPSKTAVEGGDAGRLVFIVGMPRSGTTLVERVLARLQGVVAGGENDALGFVISQYERDLAGGQLPDPQDLHPQQWAALAQRYWSLTVTKGPVVTDKMPHNYLHVGMILGMFPDARVVQMRRDARDTALSIYSRPFPLDHNYACDPHPLGHAWQLAQRYMDYWRSLDDSRVMDLEFRDFVTEPVAASQRLAEFCGLPWHEGCLQGSEEEGPSFTFSERQVRRPISPDNQGRWIRYQSVLPELFSALPDG